MLRIYGRITAWTNVQKPQKYKYFICNDNFWFFCNANVSCSSISPEVSIWILFFSAGSILIKKVLTTSLTYPNTHAIVNTGTENSHCTHDLCAAPITEINNYFRKENESGIGAMPIVRTMVSIMLELVILQIWKNFYFCLGFQICQCAKIRRIRESFSGKVLKCKQSPRTISLNYNETIFSLKFCWNPVKTYVYSIRQRAFLQLKQSLPPKHFYRDSE